MATIGQVLTTPEVGWKRYDDQDVNIIYEANGGTIAQSGNSVNSYKKTLQIVSKGALCRFNFIGSKLRIIVMRSGAYINKFKITIDGNEHNSTLSTSASNTFMVLMFEINSLENKEHFVTIEGTGDVITSTLYLDAIDIDDTGELRPYDPHTKKYLIKSDSNVYSFENITNNLIDVTTSIINPENIGVNDFTSYGFDDVSLLKSASIVALVNPKLLAYSDYPTPPTLTVNAIPKPQLIIPKDDIIIDSLDSINNFILTTNESGSGIVRTIFSIDGGFTWMTYNTVSLQFEFIDISNLNNVKTNGIDTTTFNSLGIKWNEIITEGKVRFAYYLEKELATDVAEISQLRINMDYTDSWSKSIHPTEYTYKFDNTGSYVTFLVDGTYKVNYIELVDVNETCGADIAWEVF